MGFRSYKGNTISENRWRICDRNECDIVRLPGGKVLDSVAIRKGDPLAILTAWIKWYDVNVEDVEFNYNPTDDWGWSQENAVANSNHLSGTAVDLNATKYPWGQPARNNMSAEKIAKIRQGLRLFEGTVFWGEDWDYDDPMHYQIGLPEGNAQISAFAKKLREGYLGLLAPAKGDPVARTDRQLLEDVRDQVCGFDPERKEYKGWSILGDNTLVEAVALVGVVTRRIAAKLEVDASELNGFKKP